MASRQINTFLPRVNFIQTASEDVGDGTRYPIQVTLDQIAEIFYRVRDSKFTDGYFGATSTYVNSEGNSSTTYVQVYGTPSSSLAEATSDGLQGSARGYLVVGDSLLYEPLPHEPARFEAAYTLQYASYASDYNKQSFQIRDIADDELGMWARWEGAGAYEFGVLWYDESFDTNNYHDYPHAYLIEQGNMAATSDAIAFRTGFSHNCAIRGARGNAELYGVFGDSNGGYRGPAYTDAAVNFLPIVAVVGEDADPANPANSFYLGVEFSVAWYRVNASIPTVISTRAGHYAAYGDMVASGIYFKIQLATGAPLSCPIYWEYGHIGAGGLYDDPYILDPCTDFVLTATKWWSYGGTWDPATGLHVEPPV